MSYNNQYNFIKRRHVFYCRAYRTKYAYCEVKTIKLVEVHCIETRVVLVIILKRRPIIEL